MGWLRKRFPIKGSNRLINESNDGITILARKNGLIIIHVVLIIINARSMDVRKIKPRSK